MGNIHRPLSRWERVRVRVIPNTAHRCGFPLPNSLPEGEGALTWRRCPRWGRERVAVEVVLGGRNAQEGERAYG